MRPEGVQNPKPQTKLMNKKTNYTPSYTSTGDEQEMTKEKPPHPKKDESRVEALDHKTQNPDNPKPNRLSIP